MVGTPTEDDTEPASSEPTDYKRLIEGTEGIAQFMLDPDGTIAEWPSVAETVYGFDENEAVGETLDFLYAEGKDHPSLETLLAEARHESVTQQNWHKRADDHVFGRGSSCRH
jgi:two-component system CheB/CheR fusion protein